jgi:biopolymer transport protein ExbD
LNLSLAITDRGVTVMGADAILHPEGAPEVAEGETRPPTIPCDSGGVCTSVEDYNWIKLTAKLNLIKDEYPDEEDANVILVPDNHINYEVIVQTMDASRDDPTKPGGDGKARLLFPNVVIAGGAM